MANPYGSARAYQAQAVLTASPGQLVLMLFDGALRFLGQAQEAFASPDTGPRRIERINQSIVRAQNILVELQSTLNLEAGGDYARNLDRLYDYYLRRLLEANLKKTVQPVNEVEGLLRQLRDGWAEMLRKEDAARYESVRGVA
jgi:flagellar protein FliS